MEVNVFRIKDTDLRVLSSFVLDVKQISGQWRTETTLDYVEDSMMRNFADTNDIVTIAEENSEQIGCLILHLKEGNQAEFNPWFLGGLPIVRAGCRSFDVSEHLIVRSISLAGELGITRIEMFISHEKHTEQVKSLLRHCGMTLTEELVHMRVKLTKMNTGVSTLPEFIERRFLSEMNRKDLFVCWYETFEHGQDRSFLSRDEIERRSFFNETFDFTEPFIEAASIALVHDSTVIAFSLMRPTHGEKNAHLWQMGIYPEYRGRGLAKYLLAEIKNQLRELDFATMSLNVDKANTSAYGLYRKIGLKENWCLVSYAWNSS